MKKRSINEDWAATYTGWFIIFLVFCVYWILNPIIGENLNLKSYWPSFTFGNSEQFLKIFHYTNLLKILWVYVVFGIFVIIAGVIAGKANKLTTSKFISQTLAGYTVIFLLTILANIISGNVFLKAWGLETVIFCLFLGLIISNFFKVPEWLTKTLNSEFYIKIGLILLGATILFKDIMQSGLKGMIQALVVILAVWNFCFWVCKKMKIDRELSVMLSSGVSICGVSAAVATAGAINGDKKKLSFVVSLVLIVAVPMIIILPFLAKILGFSQALAGAWFGGTIDTTGAVVASGEFFGEEALKTSTIVKFSQNVLLGVAAFVISLYWSMTGQGDREERPSPKVIWDRFPKFVLGFIIASMVFSFIVPKATADITVPFIKKMQGFWFALAFTSIGLETNFKQLFNKSNMRATWAFLIAQTFNIFFTLLIAWLLFADGYLIIWNFLVSLFS